MDFMDIHICGACRTQFNNVEHFISHKRLCPTLNRLKRQNQIESRDHDGSADSVNSTYNDLSHILSRGTSVNLQTLPCPTVSVHSSIKDINNLDKKTVTSTLYGMSASHQSIMTTATPQSSKLIQNPASMNMAEIYQETEMSSKQRPGPNVHQDHIHAGADESQHQQEYHQQESSSSQSSYQKLSNSLDELASRSSYNQTNRDQMKEAMVTQPKLLEGLMMKDIGQSSAGDQQEYQQQMNVDGISYQKQNQQFHHQQKHQQVMDNQLGTTDYEQSKQHYQSHQHQQNVHDLQGGQLHQDLQNQQSLPHHQVSNHSQEITELHQGNQHDHMQIQMDLHYSSMTMQYSQNLKDGKEHSGHQEHEQREAVTDQNFHYHKHHSNIQQNAQDHQDGHPNSNHLVHEKTHQHRHGIHTGSDQAGQVSYEQDDITQENLSNQNYDHQYISAYDPQNQRSAKKDPGNRASKQDSSTRKVRQSQPKPPASNTTGVSMDLLGQALRSENLNLHDGALVTGDEQTSNALEYHHGQLRVQDGGKKEESIIAKQTDSAMTYDLPYSIDSSRDISSMASGIADPCDPVYSTAIDQPNVALTTDVEMVPACTIEQIDADITPNSLQSSSIAATKPQYIVVKQSNQAKNGNIGVKIKGNKGKYFKCDYKDCSYQTSYFRDLDRHRRTHTGEKPYACSYCDRCFNRSDKLKIHLRAHTGEKPFKCPDCSYATVDSSSLRKHSRTHSDERPFKCQICSYASRNSSQLVVHLRVHTGDSPFQCQICQAKFKINSDLKRHSRIHTGEKPFQCDKCDYKCSVKANLKTHLRINHSEENKMSCDQCSYTSSSRKAMREHIKSHDMTVLFECPTCNYHCTSKSALVTHSRIHSEERPFSCDFCSYKCKQVGNVKTHIKKKHPEKIKLSKFFSRSERNQDPSPKEEEPKTPSKTLCRSSYKCNICTASFVREDSLRSHMRQHCRDIAMNLETTAMAVLQLQNSGTSTSKRLATTKSPSRISKPVNGRSPESKSSKSPAKVSKRTEKAQPSKSTINCGLHDIAEAATLKLSQFPNQSTDSVLPERGHGQVQGQTVVKGQGVTACGDMVPVEEQGVEYTTVVEQPTHHLVQTISGPQLVPVNQSVRLHQPEQATSGITLQQNVQFVPMDTQGIVGNNPDCQQMVELPTGELVTLKQIMTSQSVTQIPSQHVTQYQVTPPQPQDGQYTVQVVPQQGGLQAGFPVNMVPRDTGAVQTATNQPQIQIILPSSFYNHPMEGSMSNTVAQNQPQILIQVQDPNQVTSQAPPTFLTSVPQHQLANQTQTQIVTDGRIATQQVQVVQMEPPQGSDVIKTEECQSEGK